MKTEYEQLIEALDTEYRQRYHALDLELEQCEEKYWDALSSGDTAVEIECERRGKELELKMEQIGQERRSAKRRITKAAFNALSPKEQLEAKIEYSMRRAKEEWDLSSDYPNDRSAARRAYLYEKRTKKLLKEKAEKYGNDA